MVIPAAREQPKIFMIGLVLISLAFLVTLGPTSLITNIKSIDGYEGHSVAGDLLVSTEYPFVSIGDTLKLSIGTNIGHIFIKEIQVTPEIQGWESQILLNYSKGPNWDFISGQGSGDYENVEIKIPNDSTVDGKTINLSFTINYYTTAAGSQLNTFIVVPKTDTATLPVKIYTYEQKQQLINQTQYHLILLTPNVVYAIAILVLPILYTIIEMKKRNHNIYANLNASDKKVEAIAIIASISIGVLVLLDLEALFIFYSQQPSSFGVILLFGIAAFAAGYCYYKVTIALKGRLEKREKVANFRPK